VKKVILTKGEAALVDDDVYEWASQYKWVFDGRYAARRLPGPKNTNVKQYLHRQVVNAPRGIEVDHINGNKLDNRRENLRLCTRSQNSVNRPRTEKPCKSIYRGVSLYRSGTWWTAGIHVNKRKIHLGYFRDEIEAAHAYDAAAIKYHGDFARLNFPNARNP
jgi:hypothetical protein